MLRAADLLSPGCGEIVVCSDVWWLNTESVQRMPTVSIGAPETNALSAFLAVRVPSAFSVENSLAVLLDLDSTLLQACCWGASPVATAAAVDAFCDRYLESFVERALEAADA